MYVFSIALHCFLRLILLSSGVTDILVSGIIHDILVSGIIHDILVSSIIPDSEDVYGVSVLT